MATGLKKDLSTDPVTRYRIQKALAAQRAQEEQAMAAMTAYKPENTLRLSPEEVAAAHKDNRLTDEEREAANLEAASEIVDPPLELGDFTLSRLLSRAAETDTGRKILDYNDPESFVNFSGAASIGEAGRIIHALRHGNKEDVTEEGRQIAGEHIPYADFLSMIGANPVLPDEASLWQHLSQGEGWEAAATGLAGLMDIAGVGLGVAYKGRASADRPDIDDRPPYEIRAEELYQKPWHQMTPAERNEGHVLEDVRALKKLRDIPFDKRNDYVMERLDRLEKSIRAEGFDINALLGETPAQPMLQPAPTPEALANKGRVSPTYGDMTQRLDELLADPDPMPSMDAINEMQRLHDDIYAHAERLRADPEKKPRHMTTAEYVAAFHKQNQEARAYAEEYGIDMAGAAEITAQRKKEGIVTALLDPQTGEVLWMPENPNTNHIFISRDAGRDFDDLVPGFLKDGKFYMRDDAKNTFGVASSEETRGIDIGDVSDLIDYDRDKLERLGGWPTGPMTIVEVEPYSYGGGSSGSASSSSSHRGSYSSASSPPKSHPDTASGQVWDALAGRYRWPGRDSATGQRVDLSDPNTRADLSNNVFALTSDELAARRANAARMAERERRLLDQNSNQMEFNFWTRQPGSSGGGSSGGGSSGSSQFWRPQPGARDKVNFSATNDDQIMRAAMDLLLTNNPNYRPQGEVTFEVDRTRRGPTRAEAARALRYGAMKKTGGPDPATLAMSDDAETLPMRRPAPFTLGDYPTTAPEEITAKTMGEAGGQSVNVMTGENPTAGIMMARFNNGDPRVTIIPAAEADTMAQRVLEFAATNRDTLVREGNYLGTWRNPETGDIYLDVSQRFPEENLRGAVKTGERREQLEGWNVAPGERVPVGELINGEYVGNWENYINSEEYRNRLINEAEKGRALLGEGNEWWETPVLDEIYGPHADIARAFLATTATNTNPQQNVRMMTEYMRRFIKGEPIIQPEWRTPANSFFREPGAKIGLEATRVANLERSARGEPPQGPSIGAKYKALTGEDVLVPDRWWARVSEVPERGIFTHAQEGVIDQGQTDLISPNVRMAAEVAGYGGDTPLRDFSAAAWTGLEGTPGTYQSLIEDDIKAKSAAFGVTPQEFKARMGRGDAELMMWLLSVPGGAGLISQVLGRSGPAEDERELSAARAGGA